MIWSDTPRNMEKMKNTAILRVRKRLNAFRPRASASEALLARHVGQEGMVKAYAARIRLNMAEAKNCP